MYKLEKDILLYLKENLSESRFQHTINVKKKAIELANHYNEDVYKATIAALLHDCAKGFKHRDLLKKANKLDIILDKETLKSSKVIHAIVGAAIAKNEFNIDDRDILNAIKYHTQGREDMSKLEKIIFLADYVEIGRDFEGVEYLRELALIDLDEAMLKALDDTLIYLIEEKELIHPQTLNARNYIIQGAQKDAEKKKKV